MSNAELDQHILGESCYTCKALPGQPCELRSRQLGLTQIYHADRQDKGIAAFRKEQVRWIKEREKELHALL